jgi:hypothetical protein
MGLWFLPQGKGLGHFKVYRIRDINFDEGAIDNLMLPSGHKEMIYSIVRSHSEQRSDFDDFIAGKCRRLMFLLRGASGVGKTVTAG